MHAAADMLRVQSNALADTRKRQMTTRRCVWCVRADTASNPCAVLMFPSRPQRLDSSPRTHPVLMLYPQGAGVAVEDLTIEDAGDEITMRLEEVQLLH